MIGRTKSYNITMCRTFPSNLVSLGTGVLVSMKLSIAEHFKPK
jgi:hypothetical protein